jgi:integrase
VAVPKVKATAPRIFTSGELRNLLGAARGTDVEALIDAAVYTGMRLAELLRLTAEDLDFTGQIITVRKSKTGRPRWLPMMDELPPVLARLPRKDKLFPMAASGHFDRTMRAVFTRADLYIARDILKPVRCSWVSHLRLAGVAVHKVAAWAGHALHVREQRYSGLRPGDTPFPVTCLAHGVGFAAREAKGRD